MAEPDAAGPAEKVVPLHRFVRPRVWMHSRRRRSRQAVMVNLSVGRWHLSTLGPFRLPRAFQEPEGAAGWRVKEVLPCRPRLVAAYLER